jgi:hypothetical protein
VAVAAPPYAGRPLQDVLQELSGRGLQLVYSTDLVSPSLVVQREPAAGSDLALLQELLAEQGLRAERVGEGVYAVVRVPAAADAAAPGPPATPPASLESVVISASRYSLAAEIPEVHTFLTQEQLDSMPRLGEDSLKAVQRLPGAATNGLSGLAHMRGGDQDETLVMLDGLALYEPFHLRLLQSPVSLLDERIVDGLDVYTGGFTAEYGDRMSAIVDARSVRPEAERYHELGLSLFHASALAAHRFDDGRGQWLASVRRSNLDVVADAMNSDLGEPQYLDGLARVDYAFSDSTRGSLHLLLASDNAKVSNSAGTEEADAEYRNAYLWATLEHDWSERLKGRAVLSYTDVASERSGVVDEPGRRSGIVDDERDYDVLGLRLDGRYDTTRWLHRFGVDLRALSATYDYVGHVNFEPGYPFPASGGGQIDRELAPTPSGVHVAAYFTTRWQWTDALTAELGLRWDHQTYADDSDSQFAPRFNVAWSLGETTRLLASWGRYQQFQGIEELQVEDGIDRFQPAQHADHLILGLEQRLGRGFTLRAEAYRKAYGRPKFRYESLFDPLSLVPELRWDRVRIAPQSARAEGIELLLTRSAEDPWSGWFSYAWSRAVDREDDRETRRSWDQSHAVSAGAGWSEGPWRATVAATWHTGWPVTPVSVVDTPAGQAVVLGARNASRYGYFGSIDLRVSRDFDVSLGTLTGFLEVTNALDRRNPCCTDFDYEVAADGSLVLEQELRHWLPLIPSIGVLWKF